MTPLLNFHFFAPIREKFFTCKIVTIEFSKFYNLFENGSKCQIIPLKATHLHGVFHLFGTKVAIMCISMTNDSFGMDENEE